MADTVYTKNDVITSFHTHPMSKNPLPEGLEDAFFESALARYELEIKELDYDAETETINSYINRSVIYVLGILMYCEYITRELSRAEKLNGFHGKDIQMTGSGDSKRVTLADLELELERSELLFHKLKIHAYN